MVYAEASDLAVIKEAAAQSNVSEAEIIRNAIHLAALRVRRRSEPLRLRRSPAAILPFTRASVILCDPVVSDGKSRYHPQAALG